MKNKKLLYVLIPGVIFVWGMIIYKILAGAGGEEDRQFQTVDVSIRLPETLANDTFSIHPTYRDPFSGKQIKKAVVSSGQPIKTKQIVPVTASSWPQINYGGIVKNQKSNKQLVLITIGGQSFMMKVGEVFSNVELLKVFKDSIEVKYGKEKRYVRK